MKIQDVFRKVSSSLTLAVLIAGAAFTHPAFADDGGIGDGGGNAIEDGSVSSYTAIQDLLDQAKEPTRYAIQWLEVLLGVPQQDDSGPVKLSVISQKLFHGQKTVYQALDEAVFAPIWIGGCEGVNTPLEKDANSLRNPPNICFSLENLAKKLHDISGKPQLVALIAHEVSHMVGATEEEAVTIQTMIQSSFSSTAFDVSPSIASEFLLDSTTSVEYAKSALQQLNRGQPYCKSMFFLPLISGVEDTTTSVSNNMSQLGIVVPPAKAYGELVAATLKLANLFTACGPSEEKEPNGRIGSLYKGRKEVPLKDYSMAMGYSDFGQYPEVMVRWVNKNDKNTVRLELQDIINELIEVQKLSKISATRNPAGGFGDGGDKADMGGIGDGGGNVHADGPVNADIIKTWLTEAKEPTRYALHSLEMSCEMWRGEQNPNNTVESNIQIICGKLFAGSKTAYEVLDDSIFDPLPAGGCEGVKTPMEKDANSMKIPGHICFSLQRLTKKFHEISGKPQLIALIVHEVSHVVGTNEDEANTLQDLVQGDVSSSAFDGAHEAAGDFQDSILSLAGSVQIALESLGGTKNFCDSPQFMGLNPGMKDIMKDFGNDLSQMGILVPPVKGLADIYAVYVKVNNLSNACDPTSDDRARYSSMYAGRKEVSVQEYGQLVGLANQIALPNINVRWVDANDENTFRQELNDIAGLLKEVQDLTRQVRI